MKDCSAGRDGYVLGLDLGDRKSRYVLLNERGVAVEEASVPTKAKWLETLFEEIPKSRVVMEVGSQSRWVSELAKEAGHEVIVANARRVRLVYENPQKSDEVDAQWLARLGRVDTKLLHPIVHRGRQVQADLAIVRSREAVVKARTLLINHVRGMVKAWGVQLPKCGTKVFDREVREAIPQELKVSVGPIVELVGQLSEQIAVYERELKERAESYPELQGLMAIDGVGPIVASCFIWTLEDPSRFRRSRDVGPYLGLVPKRDQSGEVDRRLGITKAGDEGVRCLLVQSAHHILGYRGKDCDLRRFGLKLAEAGGVRGKKRAVVAVARKLSVLLHHLWVTGEEYDPFYQAKRRSA